jgi:quinol monooxygenase YgiN
MFGTVFTFQPNPGREQDVLDAMDKWQRERSPIVAGFVSYLVLRPKDATKPWVGVAIFDSEEHFYANADDPEQDSWYQEWRALLESDPIWNDGEVLGSR